MQNELTDPKPPAVLYGAKSTQDTRKSIPTQLADCRAFAEEWGWEVIGQFSDEGFSAYSGNRGPNLERAKRAAADAAKRHGTACMLVAQHSDRFARGAGDAPGATDSGVEVWHAMRRQNVHLRFVQNDEASKDAVYMALAAKMSHEESKRKSAATRSGKKRRAKRGDSTGPLPLGYQIASDGSRIPDPDEAGVVRCIFAMLDEGKGIGEITRWLNGRGIKTKRGNAFGRSRVREVLRNPWYGGKVRAYGEVVDGNHEPLLPWSEFERISAKLPKRGDLQGRGGRPTPVALLSGVLFCAHCGHGVWHRGTAKKDSRRRYQCGAKRHATGVCDAAPFDAQTTEEAVLEHLSDLFLDFDGWLSGVTEHRAAQREKLVRELQSVAERREALDSDEALVRTDYMKQLRGGKSAAAEVASRELETITSERGRLDAEVEDVEARLAEWDKRNAKDDMLDFWLELSRAVRTEVIDADSVREANAALKQRFAAIFVSSERGAPPTLDFILKDREPGAPVVTSQLWAMGPDDEDHYVAETGALPVTFAQHASLFEGDTEDGESGRLTLVYVQPVRSWISA